AAALAYDPKVASLLEEAGLGRLALPPARWQAEEIAAALRQAGAPGPRESFASFAGDQRRRAGRAAEAALEGLDAGPPLRSEAARFLASTTMTKVLAVLRLEEERAAWEGRMRELGRQIQALDRERTALREQRDLVLAERSDLDRRLTAFERTLAYRLVSR